MDPVLIPHVREPHSYTLDSYLRHQGYEALRKSLGMEGPTPVSALIHAATMVTAGVYMIGRNAVLFSHAPEAMQVVAVIGAATALFAGTIGLVQNDIKRVLAYSTVSQLGYMFLAMGVGAFGAGIFHLYTHAFFKALLFLGSGAVIHALHALERRVGLLLSARRRDDVHGGARRFGAATGDWRRAVPGARRLHDCALLSWNPAYASDQSRGIFCQYDLLTTFVL